MMTFNASSFIEAGGLFRGVVASLREVELEDDISYREIVPIYEDVRKLLVLCQRMRLITTASILGDMVHKYRSASLNEFSPAAMQFAGTPLKWKHVKEEISASRKCFEAEMKARQFFALSARMSSWYSNPTRGWEVVVDRFGCGDDVEEARRCIALDRPTAAVFHLMRVVEKGVLALQVFLKNPIDPKAHFGGVLCKLEAMVRKTDYEHVPDDLKPYLPFMKEVLPHLSGVKMSIRDKVTHADNRIIIRESFSSSKAKDVYHLSLGLMKVLARGLPPA